MDDSWYDDDGEFREQRFLYGYSVLFPEQRELHEESEQSRGWVLTRGVPGSGLVYHGSREKDPPYGVAAPIAGADYVYFIHAPDLGRVKIGYTSDPDSRLSSMQTGSPCQLVLARLERGNRDLERRLHHRFREKRIHGEWFDDSVLDDYARDKAA